MRDLSAAQEAIHTWFEATYTSDSIINFNEQGDIILSNIKTEDKTTLPYAELESVYESFYEDESTIRGKPIWQLELEQIIESANVRVMMKEYRNATL